MNLRLLIPAPIRRRVGRSWWWLFATLPLEQCADDIAADRLYTCNNLHIIRVSQLSPVQHTRLATGARMVCERCGLALYRTVVPDPVKPELPTMTRRADQASWTPPADGTPAPSDRAFGYGGDAA